MLVFIIFLHCSLQPCDHLLEKELTSLLLFGDVYCVFVTFPCGILGQVWYLVVLSVRVKFLIKINI